MARLGETFLIAAKAYLQNGNLIELLTDAMRKRAAFEGYESARLITADELYLN